MTGLVGCGGHAVPSVFPASGKVVLKDGQPLRGGAVVRLIPSQLEAVEGEAEISEDGTFVIKSIGDKEGAVPGKYKVVIDPKTPSQRPLAQTKQAKSAVPTRYWVPETTPLIAEVKPETNTFTFQVQ